MAFLTTQALLGGSWVVISGVISRVTIIITHIRGLITLLITTHEPPSTEVLHGGPLLQGTVLARQDWKAWRVTGGRCLAKDVAAPPDTLRQLQGCYKGAVTLPKASIRLL